METDLAINSFYVDEPIQKIAHNARIVELVDEQYHAHDAISKSKLCEFFEDSELYWHRHVCKDIPKRKSSAAMDVGTVVHACILEGKSVDDVAVEIPQECLTSSGSINSRGSNWQQWISTIGERIPMKRHEITALQNAVAVVMRRPLIGKICLDCNQFEKSVFWTDSETGLEMRLKFDALQVGETKAHCYDIKKVAGISKRAFKLQVRKFAYWIQHSQYIEGIEKLLGKPVTFSWIAVEVEPPYRVREFFLPEEYSALARNKWRRLVNAFAEASVTNNWIIDDNGQIELSEWDFDWLAEQEVDADLDWGNFETENEEVTF